jgi:DNA-binding transcriptional MerR regulator
MFIGYAQELGFSLTEIRDLLLLRRNSAHACPEVRDLIRRKLTNVEKKIAALQQVRSEITERAAEVQPRAPNARGGRLLSGFGATGSGQSKENLGTTIELLYIGDCPNYLPARAVLQEAIRLEQAKARKHRTE